MFRRKAYTTTNLFSPLFLEPHKFGMFSMFILSNHGTNHISLKYIKNTLHGRCCPVTFKLQRPKSVTITQLKHEEETNFTVGHHMGFCCWLQGGFFVLSQLIRFFVGWVFFSKPFLIFYMIKKLYLLTSH